MESSAAQASAARRASLLPTLIILAAFLAVAIVFASSSSWYLTFKAVHVTFVVIWVGGGVLLTILGVLAERRNDPVELATIARQAALVGERLFSPAAVVVLAMGIAMMTQIDWGWGQFWIIFGLIGFASTFVLGIGVLAPLSKKAAKAIDTRGAESPEAQALIARILLVARVDIAVLLLVVVDMVTKPFS
jgi:uncharacterized membrane protein